MKYQNQETKSSLEYGKEVWLIRDENGKIIEKFSCKRNALDFLKNKDNLKLVRLNFFGGEIEKEI